MGFPTEIGRLSGSGFADRLINEGDRAVGGQGMEVDVRVDPIAEALGQHHHPHPEVIPAQAGAVKSVGRLHG